MKLSRLGRRAFTASRAAIGFLLEDIEREIAEELHLDLGCVNAARLGKLYADRRALKIELSELFIREERDLKLLCVRCAAILKRRALLSEKRLISAPKIGRQQLLETTRAAISFAIERLDAEIGALLRTESHGSVIVRLGSLCFEREALAEKLGSLEQRDEAYLYELCVRFAWAIKRMGESAQE